MGAKTVEELAEQIAYALAIDVYIRDDGSFGQHPPGKLIIPPRSAHMTLSHGAEQAKPPAG